MSHTVHLPLEASIDLTYRCNNNCRHCWLRIAPSAPEKKKELSFEEIKDIVEQSRKLGTRKWSISGGEPMLRPDFADIFEYITSRSMPYSLMKDSYHEFKAMVALAKSLSKHHRIGAPWLYLSSCGDPAVNKEIEQQRLTSEQVIALDTPNIPSDERMAAVHGCGRIQQGDDRLFAQCVAQRMLYALVRTRME